MNVVEPDETTAAGILREEEIRPFLSLSRRILRASAAFFIPSDREGGTIHSLAENTDQDPCVPGRLESVVKASVRERAFGSLVVVDTPGREWTAAEHDVLDDVAGCLASFFARQEDSAARLNLAGSSQQLAGPAADAVGKSRADTPKTPPVLDVASALKAIIEVAEFLRAEQRVGLAAAHAATIQSTAETFLGVRTEMSDRLGASPDVAANGSASMTASQFPQQANGASETEAGLLDSAHILIADDLDLNRKLISDMLSVEGHVVDSVADGASAVKAAGENAYDLILMDMIMPGMDGVAATRAIRALPAPACNVPIVALTAHSLPEQLDSCIQAGMNATLTKPMSMDALTDAVATWKRRRRQAA